MNGGGFSMGYVIPVENYQYQQYQQRVTKRERDPFPIERLYPIQLDRNYDRLREKDVEQALLKKARVKQEQKDLEYMKSINNEIYAKMTGKGRQFIAKV